MASRQQMAERQAKRELKQKQKEQLKAEAKAIKDSKDNAKVSKEDMAFKRFMDRTYVADFETTTEVDYIIEGCVRVNLWGLMKLDGTGYTTGETISEFFEYVKTLGNVNIYFHNQDFDGSFIASSLLEMGFQHTTTKTSTELLLESQEYEDKIKNAKTEKQKAKYTKKLENIDNHIYGLRTGQYTELRGNQKEIYEMTVKFGSKCKVKFMDSLKLYPGTKLETLGKMVGIKKLEDFDYEKSRPIGYKFTKREMQYMYNDVKILQLAVKKMLDRFKKHKLTLTGYAYDQTVRDYELANGVKFTDHFPKTSLEDYAELNEAYQGGLTLVMPGEENQIFTEQGWVVDANSMYPYQLMQRYFPMGEAEMFIGRFQENANKDKLHIQNIKVKFTLKPGMIPCLSKTNSFYTKNIITEKDLKTNILSLTDVDLKHFFINYEVHEIEYLGGWMFDKTYAPFKNTIEKFMKDKVVATKAGDQLGRLISKLLANGVYGKFAQNPRNFNIITQLDENDCVEFVTEGYTEKAKNYLPIAIWTTAYGRDTLLTAAYTVLNDSELSLKYMDTDSLHFTGDHLPHGLDLDSSRIGAWDCEARFDEAIYLRAKCYAERVWTTQKWDDEEKKWVTKTTIKESEKMDTKIDVKASGIYEKAKKKIVNIDDFHFGQTFENCKGKKRVKGGMLIINVTKKLIDNKIDELDQVETKINQGFKKKIAS